MPSGEGHQQQFGNRVREERLRLQLSQEDLGHLADLDRTYISDVERGSRNIGLQNIWALATALGLQPADLLRPNRVAVAQLQQPYRYDPTFRLNCGFMVTSEHVLAAMESTGRILDALPLSLFTTVDLKTQSGIVGAVFAAELATQTGGLPNPIEKGHPDIVPLSAASASEAQLRNYPTGLEIKCTLGNVPKGSGLSAGHSRIEVLTGVTWQAHHRDVRELLGLIWTTSLEALRRVFPILT